NFIYRLQREDEVAIPIFDRSLELSRSSAVIISKNTKIIIVEGNYILLNSHPWKELHKFFNSTIMINCKEKVLEERLIERWKKFKLSKQEINQKVYKNDLPNGINVLKNSITPDYNLQN
ncbi:MAG: nucleoside/nucleotide kinase family protein, partial [Alphaproteobacteria bacterium]|nr:nucleoside/nucleotide kinase family protein [Alphaproteobacteria bacterium]